MRPFVPSRFVASLRRLILVIVRSRFAVTLVVYEWLKVHFPVRSRPFPPRSLLPSFRSPSIFWAAFCSTPTATTSHQHDLSSSRDPRTSRESGRGMR